MRIFLITFFMSIFFTSPSTSQESFYDLNLKSIEIQEHYNYLDLQDGVFLILNTF